MLTKPYDELLSEGLCMILVVLWLFEILPILVNCIVELHICDIHAGVYELVPYYKGENTVFDVSPPSVTVTVQHDHATVSEKFQVHQRYKSSFSNSGNLPSEANLWISGQSCV